MDPGKQTKTVPSSSLVPAARLSFMLTGAPDELNSPFAVEIVVPDLAPVVAFYRSLGFRTERETPGFVALRWADSYFFVAQDPRATTGPRWANIRLLVPDVDAVRARVRQLGLPVVSEIGDRSYGLRDFTVRDPAGFEVRFAQVL